MRRFTIVSSALAMLGVSAMAQTVTVPAAYATTEGPSSFHAAQYNPARYQTVYGSKLMQTTPMLVKGIKYRGNGTSSSGVAHKYTHTVIVSNQLIDPLTGYGIRWTGNHGKDMTTVMNKVSVSWPAFTGTASPRKFNVDLPFTKPFPYIGKAFVVDVENHKDATTNYSYSYYIDAVLGTGTNTVDYGKGARGGQGCPYSTTASLRFGVSGYLLHQGGPFYMYSNSQVNKLKLPGMCFHGISKTSWGAVPLPFDMTPVGAPGCNLYTNIITYATSFTDPASASGYILFDMGTVPHLNSLVGANLVVQMFVIDPTYNTLGMRLTDYVEFTVGGGLSGKMDGFTFYGYESSATTANKLNPDFCTYSYQYVPIIQLY